MRPARLKHRERSFAGVRFGHVKTETVQVLDTDTPSAIVAVGDQHWWKSARCIGDTASSSWRASTILPHVEALLWRDAHRRALQPLAASDRLTPATRWPGG
jgi:hypothetical protein